MSYLFLCGSLEPGRDGVGDYVQQLAAELIRQGHKVSAIALNDQHIQQEFFGEQLAGATKLSVLRLPASWLPKHRFNRALHWVDEFQPTWISLQFVPYAFQTKGLPVLLSWHLRRLIRGRQVHVMMHEIWIGAGPSAGLKTRLVAQLQKLLVHTVINRLRPAAIHTHLPIYCTQLQRLGHTVLPLPLFSNIPVVLAPLTTPDATVFRVGIFSQANNSAAIAQFLNNLTTQLFHYNQRCHILLMGGRPTEMQALASELATINGLRGQVQYAGFLEPAQLSAALQSCQLGLTSVPRHGLGKSGSVAAFLAHGIPVAAPVLHPEYQTEDVGFFSDSLRACILLQPTMPSLQAARVSASSAKYTIQVSTVAHTFLADLARA